jgi:tellurium resistance protein TerZ
MIDLKKGSRFNLKKNDAGAGGDGSSIERFCVGCKWGMVKAKKLFGLFSSDEDVDLDLSCVMFNRSGEMVDWIYSPDYRPEFLKHYGYGMGKLVSNGGGVRHSGDDRQGGSSDADNEVIVVDTKKINPGVSTIVFFLNYVDDGNKNCDFSKIPFASIRLFEGDPDKVDFVHAQYNVASDPSFAGRKAMIMGKLVRTDQGWSFDAIGEATEDSNLCETMNRIKKSYVN